MSLPIQWRAGLQRCFCICRRIFASAVLCMGLAFSSTADCPEYDRLLTSADLLSYQCPRAFLPKANSGCELGKIQGWGGWRSRFGPWGHQHRSRPVAPGVAPTSAVDCGRASPISCLLLEQRGGGVRAAANNCLAPRLRWFLLWDSERLRVQHRFRPTRH